MATLDTDEHKDALGWRCQLHVEHYTNVPYLEDISGFLGFENPLLKPEEPSEVFFREQCVYE